MFQLVFTLWKLFFTLLCDLSLLRQWRFLAVLILFCVLPLGWIFKVLDSWCGICRTWMVSTSGKYSLIWARNMWVTKVTSQA